ncbi:putative glucose-6-phosphate/phosphate and phosphoenolpyruvate/phosphate antiporter [Trichostrongylus colubriformis]|uniref:Glucose-6-phosphate/phosphate and phosphoenolpyruvate/phosphate antiporter n=1 Tax=Trichostrongylus colubriformis TaxID=6319 RepID=A0AAN8F678_TRICO
MNLPFTITPSCHFKARVVIICLFWYVISSASSITNKVLLQSYPYPTTLALSNLMWVPLYSMPLLRMWECKVVKLTPVQFNKYLVPISAGKALAVVSAYVSLWKVPVSYAHTVKASMPIFAVFLSRILLKERQSYRVYLSLLPIVAGVVVASATELSFSLLGLLSALLSTFTYSLMNILVKKLLKESEIHPIRLLAMNSQLAAVIVFPFWLYNDAFTMTGMMGSSESVYPSPDLWLLCLLAMTGVLSFLQSLCAFSLIHQLTALSYAVCNATKRITVIGSSLFTLHNPVTGANVFGMILSILGVFCYNRAKQEDKILSHSLPLTRSHTVLSESTLVEMDTSQDNDLMYWAANNRSGYNGSRLGDFEYTDTYQARYDKMDDISKEQYSRRHNS